jgi:hypothetical protein
MVEQGGGMTELPSRLEEEIYRFCKPKEYRFSSLWPKALMGSGRAVRHVRMAARFTGSAENWPDATYHAVAGVAAAHATIDALLVFLNFWLELGCETVRTVDGYPGLTWIEPGRRIGAGQTSFMEKLNTAAPSAAGQAIEDLSRLAEEIGPYRHRALHRDGLRVHRLKPTDPWRFYSDRYSVGFMVGDAPYWTPPLGQEYPTGDELPVPDVLADWADRLESIILTLMPALAPLGSPESKP